MHTHTPASTHHGQPDITGCRGDSTMGDGQRLCTNRGCAPLTHCMRRKVPGSYLLSQEAARTPQVLQSCLCSCSLLQKRGRPPLPQRQTIRLLKEARWDAPAPPPPRRACIAEALSRQRRSRWPLHSATPSSSSAPETSCSPTPTVVSPYGAHLIAPRWSPAARALRGGALASVALQAAW